MRRSRLNARLFLGVFLVYALYFMVTMLQPTYYLVGDEVYYVMMSSSLWDDGDLNLEDEYTSDAYRAFYPQPLTEKDIRGHMLWGWREGMYSKHGAGLPVLMLPAWALGRQVGVSLYLVIVTALLTVQLFALMRKLVTERSAVWLAWVGLVISPPLILYASAVYTEIPAALAIVIVLRYGILQSPMRGHSRWMVLAGLLVLPWLNPRHILFVLPLAVAIGWKGHWRLVAVAIIGTILPFVHFWFLLGYVPILGNYGTVALGRLFAGLLGLWLDVEAGLLPYGPIYLLAVYGLVRAIRTKSSLWLLWNGLWLPYFLFLSAFNAWSGGFNPPSRMMVPLIPFLAPLVALALAEMTLRLRYIVAAVLGASGLVVSGLFLAYPMLKYNHHTGQSHIFEQLALRTGINLNAFWPSFIRQGPFSYWQAGLIIVGAAIVYGLLFTRGYQTAD